MKKIQINLDENMFQLLRKESKLKKKSISSIVRDILREKFMKSKNIDAVKAAAGIWKDRNFYVDEYVRNLRKGKRLEELYRK